jgi:hypothetical protein
MTPEEKYKKAAHHSWLVDKTFRKLYILALHKLETDQVEILVERLNKMLKEYGE